MIYASALEAPAATVFVVWLRARLESPAESSLDHYILQGLFYLATFATFCRFTYRINQRFPKVCLGSATSSQGIRGYISVMVTLKFTYFFN